MKKIILPIVVSVICGSAYADKSVHYDENGHDYERIDTSMSWDDAKEFCEDSDGHLATITSRDENDFVFEELAEDVSSSLWLGGTDESRENSWRWVTGEEWDYDNWNSGQPNDKNDGQDYLSFNSRHSRRWDDNGLPHNNDRKRFICEYDHSSDDCEATYKNGRLKVIIWTCDSTPFR